MDEIGIFAVGMVIVPGGSMESAQAEEIEGLKYEENDSGVISIGRYAFDGCNKLTEITLSSGITSIEASTFNGCSSLTGIILPCSVTTIGSSAFYNCSSLKNIYYSGSQEQWNKIKIDENGNNCLKSTAVAIHYDYVVPKDPTPGESDDSTGFVAGGAGDSTPSVTETSGKTAQTITARNSTKTYGAKPFSLGAKSSAGTKLTYYVSNKKVATADKKGKVTIKGCGITNITIIAPETETYSQAQATIKLTVKPKKVTVSSVKSAKRKTAVVKWKKDKKASGYLVEFATDSKFKKNKVRVAVNKNKTVKVKK